MLAYKIMLADMYWYSGKVVFADQRQLKYLNAKRIYQNLLHMAECSLSTDDNSLLTIANKLLQIGIECNAMIDAETMKLCENVWFKSSTSIDHHKSSSIRTEIANNLIVWYSKLSRVQYHERSY